MEEGNLRGLLRQLTRRSVALCIGGVMTAIAAQSTHAAEHPGKRAYDRYCAGCHGVAGDGKGPAAIFLDPKPRDFTSGKFKFGSVPAGELPTDQDLDRILVHGLSGTSMPAWPLLPQQERAQIIEYIKTFSPEWHRSAPGVPIAVTEDPYRGDVESIRKAVARGEVVYHTVTTCWQCHPGYVSAERFAELYAAQKRRPPPLRPDFHKPVMKPDGWGQPLMPTDFKTDRIKTGIELKNLFIVIAAGIGGTAMPTWKDSIPDEDIWALAYYVRWLADQRNDRLRNLPLAPLAVAMPASGGAR